MIDLEVFGVEKADSSYRISVIEEIRRVLITKKGSIPMNPNYGSNLYLYRDRTLDSQTKLGIISETFEAIEENVSRVKPSRVDVVQNGDGNFALKIWLEAKDAS